MRREIKFRARVTENGKPYLFYQHDQYLISFLRRATNFLAWQKDGEGRHESYLKDYELEKSLDQYTGLKDKHGVEIYEGDLVEHRNFINELLGSYEIAWGVFGFTTLRGAHESHYITPNELVVIGNIYENPELLEKEAA